MVTIWEDFIMLCKLIIAYFILSFIFMLVFIFFLYILTLIIRFMAFAIGFLLKRSLMNPYIKQHLIIIGDNLNYEEYLEEVERDERKSGKKIKRYERIFDETGLEKKDDTDDEGEKHKKKKKKKK